MVGRSRRDWKSSHSGDVHVPRYGEISGGVISGRMKLRDDVVAHGRPGVRVGHSDHGGIRSIEPLYKDLDLATGRQRIDINRIAGGYGCCNGLPEHTLLLIRV